MLSTAFGNYDRNLIRYINGGNFDDIMFNGDHTQLAHFLAHSGPDARDDKERTVLMRAANTGSLLTVGRLLDMGADPHLRDPHGMTALHFAAREGDDGVVEMLLGAGAKIDAIDEQNRTPLWYACANNLPDSAIVEILLNAGADSHLRDNAGVSPEDML